MTKRKELTEEQAQAQAEAEKAEESARLRKAQDDAALHKAMSDYERMLSDVLMLQTMTDSEAWKAVWGGMLRFAQGHKDALVTAETKMVPKHQAAVMMVAEFQMLAEKPVRDLVEYCNSMSLFAAQFKTRAEFNKTLGTVTIRSI